MKTPLNSFCLITSKILENPALARLRQYTNLLPTFRVSRCCSSGWALTNKWVSQSVSWDYIYRKDKVPTKTVPYWRQRRRTARFWPSSKRCTWENASYWNTTLDGSGSKYGKIFYAMKREAAIGYILLQLLGNCKWHPSLKPTDT